jgi:hypothetical protein
LVAIVDRKECDGAGRNGTRLGSVFLMVALSVYANILADSFHQFIQAAASFGPIHFFQRLIQGMR